MWFKDNKSKDFLWRFTNQLSLLYQSGIPLSQALNLLTQEKQKSKDLELLQNLEHQIIKGKSLYASLKRYPNIFPRFYVKLIELGEHSGRLQEILINLAENLEQQRNLKRQISKAMFYPSVVFIVNCAIVLALLWFVVPQYANFFGKNQANLPLLTQLLLTSSEELHQHFFINLMLISFLITLLRYFIKQKNYQRKLLKISSQIYGVKNLLILRNYAVLCRNLSLCLQAGLTLTQSLGLCKALSNNPNWNGMLENIIEDINRGKNFFNALKKHEVPALILQFIKIGEDTGRLEQQLLKLALIYEQNLSDHLNKLTQLIEPLMMIVLGLIVGLIMYALYQPLIQIGNFV